jgi:hypothetical protein
MARRLHSSDIDEKIKRKIRRPKGAADFLSFSINYTSSIFPQPSYFISTEPSAFVRSMPAGLFGKFQRFS